MNRLIAGLFAVATVLIPAIARAEIVWTCVQPSVIDQSPTSARYSVVGTNEIEDELGFRWRLIRNDPKLLVAVFSSDVSTGARTLVIDPKSGNMVLTISDTQDRTHNFIITGTCGVR